MKLREYQRDAVVRVANSLAEVDNVLLVSPTGAGKTVMAAEVARTFSRVLLIAHRRELVEQLRRAVSGPHVVASTIQSAHTVMDAPDLIVVDEAHHIVAKSYGDLIARFPGAKILGMTATPQRLDGKPLKKVFDTVVETPGIEVLQQSGHLVYADEFTPSTRLDLSEIKSTGGDYNLAELGQKVRRVILFGDVIRDYRERAAGESAFAFCVDVAHSKEVAEAFNQAGIPAAHIDGTMSKDVRGAALKDFEEGRVKVLCNCNLLTEGFDAPAASVAIMLRPTKSLATYLQMAGRVLRTAPNKQRAIVLDHARNVLVHGSVNEKRTWHYETRERTTGGYSERTPFPSVTTRVEYIDDCLVAVNKPMPFFSGLVA
ncbi:MAG TPA: DEAD/DEAH box helicase [Thiomonas arsenitoxydans]|uniref:DEAD/DEAH box helicase n=1 Tax=Thiomonas arsenitoxydans (strain DSM 22701 / CIP 110005 / 3As) TaxID=426114 RepID=UPI002BDE9961|nr:DEAD/DEAH box helicase [Thiomonas arsenitoxydans]HML83304.1 DEAD/DEAH box helicase [Thiomonas arsenitoxydans]